MSRMDGADLPVTDKAIIFSQVRAGADHFTELSVINPGDSGATLQLKLVMPETAPLALPLHIPSKGVARLDVASFFNLSEISSGSYILASSDAGIAGFAMLSWSEGDSVGMNARSASEQMITLYFPQVAVLGPWKADLGLLNYSTQPVIVTISAFRPDGAPYSSEHLQNNPVTRSLDAGECLVEGYR